MEGFGERFDEREIRENFINNKEKREIVEQFIQRNKFAIDFSIEKFYKSYMPHSNPLLSLSSFAKNRGIIDADKLAKELFDVLWNRTAKIEKRKEVKEIIEQILKVFEQEQIDQKREKKKKEEADKLYNKNEEIRKESKKKGEQHQEEVNARHEKKEEKEKREEQNTFKKRLINMGMTEKEIDTMIEALLQDNEILETFIDTASANKLRKDATYGGTEKDINNPKIQNIVKRFKWKIENETAEIPDLNEILQKPKTPQGEIDITYNNGKIETTIDKKTYEICKNNKSRAINLIEEKFEIRSWLLGRIIEYVQMDILKEKIRPYMTWPYSIRKTDIIDDTMTGIDYILTFSKTTKNTEGKEITSVQQCYIDATTALHDDTLFKKSKDAKNAKVPYNYIIERAKELCGRDKEDQHLNFPEWGKFIDEWEQYTTPYLISKAIEYIEKWESYKWFLKDFLNMSDNEKTLIATDFSQHLRGQRRNELKYIMKQAKSIDIEKIEELSMPIEDVA